MRYPNRSKSNSNSAHQSRSGKKPTRWLRTLALLLSIAMVAAACGEDSTDVGETTESTQEATETTQANETATSDVMESSGEPIKVMATGTIESPAFSIPSIPVGAQVAIDEINAAGGINGRPLELIECNDEFDPSKATTCIQTAIQEGAVAVVGGLSVFEPLLLPLMEGEGMPWVANSLVAVPNSPVTFPVAGDGITAFAGIGAAAVLRGCENPAIVISAQSSPSNASDIRSGIEAFGGTVAAELQVNGPDLAPLVESAIAEGADCIASGASPAELGGLLAAVAGRMPVTTVDASLPQPLLDGLGEAANGLHVVSGFLLNGDSSEKVKELEAASAALAPGVGLDQFWFTGYAGVKLVAEALKDATDVSSASVLAGLSGVSNFDTEVGAVLDFTTPNPVEARSRLFNTELYIWDIQGGKYTLLQEDTIDMQPAIELTG